MAARRTRGALEAAVLRALWDTDRPLTARDVRELLDPGTGTPALTTVLTVLNVFGREEDRTFNNTAFRQQTLLDDDGNPVLDDNGDEILVPLPVGSAISWRQPRRYELGFRLEF